MRKLISKAKAAEGSDHVNGLYRGLLEIGNEADSKGSKKANQQGHSVESFQQSLLWVSFVEVSYLFVFDVENHAEKSCSDVQ